MPPFAPPLSPSHRPEPPSGALRAIEWFLPEVPSDRVMRLRARLFVVLSFLVTANMVLFAALHTLHHVPDSDGTNIAVMLGVAALNASFPFLMRARVGLPVLSVGFVLVLQLGVIVLACYDLGMASGAVFWLVVTPLAAAFLGGARLGWAAAGISVAGGLGMVAATTLGWTFPTSLPPDKAGLHHLLSFLCCTGSVAALAALYEGPMVSSLRQLADQLHATNDQLERELVERRRAQAQAEAASRAKDVLLSNMSHEFRTPLAAILGFSDLLMSEVEGPQRDFLREIDANAHRLRTTLDGMLDLTWAESAGAEVMRRPLDVLAVAETVVQAHQAEAAGKGLAIEAHGDAACAFSDPDLLVRVLAALVDNAVRFTEVGHVTVAVWDVGSEVLVEVADTGIGMPDAFVARATTPFQQASQGDARTHEGAGLGLTVAARLVDLLGGTMHITSAPGRGTTVHLHLPAATTTRAGASGDGEATRSLPMVGMVSAS